MIAEEIDIPKDLLWDYKKAPDDPFWKHFAAWSHASVFYLTGGTALSAFYLHHRLSEDLDFFTESDVETEMASRGLNMFFKEGSSTVLGIRIPEYEEDVQ